MRPDAFAERARRQPTESVSLVAEGKARRLLAGVPVAIKDVISTRRDKDRPCSKILQNYFPPYELRAAVERLEAAGAASFFARPTFDEFAWELDEMPAYGPVTNPLSPDRVPGGSSGGSAAGWRHCCKWRLWEPYGGSIRQPASLCGLPR